MKKPTRARGQSLGRYGKTVRLFRQGGAWKVHCRGLGVYRTFRGDTAEDEARGFAERLAKGEATGQPDAPTVGDLWAAYTAASDYRELRPRSRAVYAEGWDIFATVVPQRTPCDEVTVATLEVVRTALETTKRPRTERPYALNTIRKALQVVKIVFAWGERTEYLHRNRIHSFKFKVGKDSQPQAPEEYTEAEYQALLGALSFDKVTQRTPYTVLVLCGHQGVRINAALHLRWEDVNWETGVLHWASAWDKQGNEWAQPMRVTVRAVLGRLWDSVDRPATGWVFPARRKGAASPTYTVQSFWSALCQAEIRAGVEQKPGRSSHSLRRKLAGDLAAVVSDGDAMRAIGDRDPRMAQRYIKTRGGRVAETLNRLDEGVA